MSVASVRYGASSVTLERASETKLKQYVTVRKYPAVVYIYKAYFCYTVAG
jgi:hypothetical protein